MRVVASFVGGWGHAEPLVPLARLAEGHGHRVIFAGQAAVVGRLGAVGFETVVVGPDTLATTPKPLVPVDRAAERVVVRDHFVAEFGRHRARHLGALLDEVRPGLVVCDEMDVGSVAAAECRGIPCVSVAVLAAGALMGPSNVGAAWRSLRADLGLDDDPNHRRIGGDLAVAPFPHSLRSPVEPVPPAMRFVRPPILDEVVPADPSGPPVVYVTLGTVFGLESGDLLERLVGAMATVSDAHDLDVVVTTGPGIDTSTMEPRHPRVRLAAFVPQRELLGRCRAVVCHAGSGTLAATLSLGIPVVMLPLGADQPDNADRCAELGVGVALDPIAATAADIAEATDIVLTDDRYRTAAAGLATEAAAQPALATLPELRSLRL